jgi:hypothetical protein
VQGVANSQFRDEFRIESQGTKFQAMQQHPVQSIWWGKPTAEIFLLRRFFLGQKRGFVA